MPCHDVHLGSGFASISRVQFRVGLKPMPPDNWVVRERLPIIQ